MKRVSLLVIFTLFSSMVFAGGWTNKAVPTSVEVVRSQGFMITGNFGNPAECSQSNFLWVAIEHPQYDQLYSMALSALNAGKRIRAYSHACTEIGWHGGSFNTVRSSGAMYVFKD